MRVPFKNTCMSGAGYNFIYKFMLSETPTVFQNAVFIYLYDYYKKGVDCIVYIICF